MQIGYHLFLFDSKYRDGSLKIKSREHKLRLLDWYHHRYQSSMV